jgi:hypothetical protein
MATKETPFAALKRLHETKEKLVASLVGPLTDGQGGDDAESLKARLLGASNKQLLHLAEVVGEVKKRYGGRDQLIAAVGKITGKAKDKDYLTKLGTFSLSKLLDLAKAAERRAKRAAS